MVDSREREEEGGEDLSEKHSSSGYESNATEMHAGNGREDEGVVHVRECFKSVRKMKPNAASAATQGI